MSIQKQKIFPIQKKIKLNYTLINNLDRDLRICQILIKKNQSTNTKIFNQNPIIKSTDNNDSSLEKNIDEYNQNENDALHIESPLRKILENNLNRNELSNRHLQNSQNIMTSTHNLFTIRTMSEFNIPFLIECFKEFSGSIGSVIIFYRDEGLDQFDESQQLLNQTELIFPNLYSKIFDIILNCNVMNKIESRIEIPFNITISNNSDEFRRIVFMIDTSMNYLTSGQVKKKIILYPNEVKELNLSLIPITLTCNKLPPFKIMEFPLANNTYENKVYSIYYLPDNNLL